MKFMFIDDSKEMLSSLERAFLNYEETAFAECHNVEDALLSIAQHKPDVLFLDHHLTDGGNEGLEIINQVKGVKIYSTTSDANIALKYQMYGIENVKKTDLEKIKSIIYQELRERVKMRETIKLQDVKELLSQEHIAKVPELVQRYLDAKIQSHQAEGKHFRIVIEKERNPKDGAGIAMSNELRVEKYNSESWSKVYGTGMMQYRGAYAQEIDRWDLSLNDPMIFEESEDEVVYAIRTGGGNIKIYRFRENCPKEEVRFNIRDHQSTQKRVELLQKAFVDPEAFCQYVSEEQRGRWKARISNFDYPENHHVFDKDGNTLEYDNVAEKADVVVIIAKEYDRDYDPICEYYRFYFWVKGHGIGDSWVYPTRNHHPDRRFYVIGVYFEVSQTKRERNFIELEIEVGNRKQKWRKIHHFRLELLMPKVEPH